MPRYLIALQDSSTTWPWICSRVLVVSIGNVPESKSTQYVQRWEKHVDKHEKTWIIVAESKRREGGREGWRERGDMRGRECLMNAPNSAVREAIPPHMKGLAALIPASGGLQMSGRRTVSDW